MFAAILVDACAAALPISEAGLALVAGRVGSGGGVPSPRMLLLFVFEGVLNGAVCVALGAASAPIRPVCSCSSWSTLASLLEGTRWLIRCRCDGIESFVVFLSSLYGSKWVTLLVVEGLESNVEPQAAGLSAPTSCVMNLRAFVHSMCGPHVAAAASACVQASPRPSKAAAHSLLKRARALADHGDCVHVGTPHR